MYQYLLKFQHCINKPQFIKLHEYTIHTIIHAVYIHIWICHSVSQHLGCFYFLAIKNKAVLNMFVQVYKGLLNLLFGLPHLNKWTWLFFTQKTYFMWETPHVLSKDKLFPVAGSIEFSSDSSIFLSLLPVIDGSASDLLGRAKSRLSGWCLMV